MLATIRRPASSQARQALRAQFDKLKREKAEVEARIGVRNTAIKQLTAKKERLGMSERAAGDAKVGRRGWRCRAERHCRWPRRRLPRSWDERTQRTPRTS